MVPEAWQKLDDAHRRAGGRPLAETLEPPVADTELRSLLADAGIHPHEDLLAWFGAHNGGAADLLWWHLFSVEAALEHREWLLSQFGGAPEVDHWFPFMRDSQETYIVDTASGRVLHHDIVRGLKWIAPTLGLWIHNEIRTQLDKKDGLLPIVPLPLPAPRSSRPPAPHAPPARSAPRRPIAVTPTPWWSAGGDAIVDAAYLLRGDVLALVERPSRLSMERIAADGTSEQIEFFRGTPACRHHTWDVGPDEHFAAISLHRPDIRYGFVDLATWDYFQVAVPPELDQPPGRGTSRRWFTDGTGLIVQPESGPSHLVDLLEPDRTRTVPTGAVKIGRYLVWVEADRRGIRAERDDGRQSISIDVEALGADDPASETIHFVMPRSTREIAQVGFESTHERRLIDLPTERILSFPADEPELGTMWRYPATAHLLFDDEWVAAVRSRLEPDDPSSERTVRYRPVPDMFDAVATDGRWYAHYILQADHSTAIEMLDLETGRSSVHGLRMSHAVDELHQIRLLGDHVLFVDLDDHGDPALFAIDVDARDAGEAVRLGPDPLGHPLLAGGRRHVAWKAHWEPFVYWCPVDGSGDLRHASIDGVHWRIFAPFEEPANAAAGTEMLPRLHFRHEDRIDVIDI